MFEQTKALCKKFLDMGIPSFDLIVYKDGECIFRHMGDMPIRIRRYLYAEMKNIIYIRALN